MDEMEVSPQLDFDKNTNQHYGFVTLGDKEKLSDHLTVVLIRGVATNWKQVIGVEATSGTYKDIKPEVYYEFLKDCVTAVEEAGLKVISLTSDMGNSNRRIWSHLNIDAKSSGFTNNKFSCNDHDVYVMPDVCHLLKNLKLAIMKNVILLPDYVKTHENLPTNKVSASYVTIASRNWR